MKFQKIRIPAAAVKNLKILGLRAFPKKEDAELRGALFLMAVWIIITDKIFESEKNSDKRLESFIAIINSIMHKKNKNYQENELFAESYNLFKKIYRTVENKAANPSIVRLWEKSINDFLTAMKNERSHSAKKIPPLAAYIKNGAKSIGSDPTFYALLMIYSRGRLSLYLKEFGIIKKIINQASLILRLANDIGSYERERKEGKINSVEILSKRVGSYQKARAILLKKIGARRQAIKRLHQSINGESRYFSGALCRIVDFNVKLYKISDYYEK